MLLKVLATRYPLSAIKQFAALKTYHELCELTASHFNLVLGGYGISIAAEMEQRYGIPYKRLTTCYHPDEIRQVTVSLNAALGIEWDLAEADERMQRLLITAAAKWHHKPMAIAMGGRSLELAWLFKQWGFNVSAVIVGSLLYNYVLPGGMSYITGKGDKWYGEQLIKADADLDVYLANDLMRFQDCLQEVALIIAPTNVSYCSHALHVQATPEYKFGYDGILEILEGMQWV